MQKKHILLLIMITSIFANTSFIDAKTISASLSELLECSPTSITSLPREIAIKPVIPSSQLKTKIFALKKELKQTLYTNNEKRCFSEKSTQELILLLKQTKNQNDAIKAIDYIIRQVFSTLREIEKKETKKNMFLSLYKKTQKYLGHETNKKLYKKIKLIFNHTMICASNIYTKINLDPSNPERKYAISLLETVLFQKKATLAYSHQTILKEITTYKKTATPQATPVNISKLCEQCPSQEIKIEWKSFVQQLQQNKNHILIMSLNDLLEKLNQLEIIPHWFQNSFIPTWNQTNHKLKPTALLLTQEFTHSKDFLEELAYKKHRLSLFSTAIKKNPKSIQRQWISYKKHILPFFIASTVSQGQKEHGLSQGYYNFNTSFSNARPLSKIAATSIMMELVTNLTKLESTLLISPIDLFHEKRKLFTYWKEIIPKRIFAKQEILIKISLKELKTLTPQQFNVLATTLQENLLTIVKTLAKQHNLVT